MKINGTLKKSMILLLVLVMLSGVVSPVMAANTCSACGKNSANPNAKVAVIEVKGLEKNKALAKALNDEDVKKLMNELVKKGHKPELAKAVVSKIIGEYGEATYVFISFKASKGYKKVGLAYVIAENGCRALAVETYEKNGRNYANAYYIDANGNIVVLSGDEDYWTCVGLCIAQFCAENWEYCEICWGFCSICIVAPDPWFCGMCLACIGAPVAYCAITCSI